MNILHRLLKSKSLVSQGLRFLENHAREDWMTETMIKPNGSRKNLRSTDSVRLTKKTNIFKSQGYIKRNNYEFRGID